MSHTLSSIRRSSVAVAFVLGGGLARFAAAQTAPPDEIVLWTSRAGDGDVHGDWRRLSDSSAAGGFALLNPDLGRSRVVPALASPTNYFEIAFTAKGATAYHLWIRMRADRNRTANDSVHVQFSDSVTASGSPTMRIGTTSSAEPVLQNGSGGQPPRVWGWTDNGWGSLGTPIYFAADGTHVVRVQQREDGAVIDQIVLSARTYSSTPPGSRRDDTRILPATGGGATAPSTSTVVIQPATAAAGRMFGSWQLVADSSAAGGQAVRTPNAGATTIAPALSNPASYFEASFTASAGRAYHVWVRMRADGNSTANDSVHLQFSGSVTSGGSTTARIGTTSSLEAVLQAGSSGADPRGWGWTDNGYGSFGSHIYFATTGTQTIRVQQREDGATIDQIVITPDTFLTSSPGWRQDDQTIIPPTQTTPINLPPAVTMTSPGSGATFTAPAIITMAATASDPENRLSRVDFFNGSTLLTSDATSPFSYSWSGVPAGTYTLRATAYDSDGRQATSAAVTVTVQTANPPANQPPTVSLTAPANGATYTAPATIAMAATAADPEGRLARVDFYNGSTLLGGDTTAPFSYSWNGVAAGTYGLKAIARDNDGGSTSSATVSLTVTGASALPDGQVSQDIGAPAVAGSASYSGGTYTIRAAGVDIWDTSDQFHFVYRPFSGDVMITARVASLQAVDPWSKAGVMIRETLTGGSRHAFAHPTPANSYRLTRRFNISDVSSSTAAASGGAPPGWVRLIRRGNTFDMYRSTDGLTWTAYDSIQISMASTVYVGLAVTSHNASTATTAVLDSLSVTTPANLPPTVALTAPVTGSSFIAPATITLSATATDPEGRLAKVDFYNGSTLLASDTTSPFSYAWSGVAAGSYQLRAVATDTGGASASSAIAAVSVGTATSTTRRVAFTASVDHAIVTSYLLEVFPSTANPATATAMTSSDLGKPTPSGANEIIVDRTTFLNNLAPGNYLITVASIGSGGKSRSAAISFTR